MADQSSALPVVSSLVQSLPLKDVFAAPLNAAIEAHNAACSALQTFIDKVGHDPKTGEIKKVEFNYSENVGAGEVKRTITVPLISVLPMPAFGIDKLVVDFDVKVDASEQNQTDDAKSGSVEAGVGFGPVSAKLQGSLSHKSEQTRKTDTSARYTVHMEASRQPMPEAFNRVIDILLSRLQPADRLLATPPQTAQTLQTPQTLPNPAVTTAPKL